MGYVVLDLEVPIEGLEEQSDVPRIIRQRYDRVAILISLIFPLICYRD